MVSVYDNPSGPPAEAPQERGLKAMLRRRLHKIAPRGVGAHLKLARLAAEKNIYRRRIDHREFRESLLALGEWQARPVWVQASLNDFYNVDMRPSEVLEMLVDLIGPRGTLLMPTTPLKPDPFKVLMIDTVPSQTGMLTEILRRTPGAHRSLHLYSAVSAFGVDAEPMTADHHKDIYPWGDLSPYGRVASENGLMVGLGIVPLGFTPLHGVECTLHHQVPRFARVFPGETVTYDWKRSSGETGRHTTLRRHGDIDPGKLISLLPPGLLTRFRRSNLTFQAAPAQDAVEALKTLALRGKTIYQGR